MLRVILNRFKPQAEEIIAEEQASSEPGEAPQNKPSTPESCVNSIFNISKICTVFIDFKTISQDMACSLKGHHAEKQYQCKCSPCH